MLFLAFCVLIRFVSSAPIVIDTADYIDFPKRPSKGIDYMNDEDAKLFYATALAYPDVRCKTAALILLLTGIRRGELCGPEWSNIDLDEGTITIERSVTTVKGVGLVEKDPKTESSKRVISISDKLVAVLAEQVLCADTTKGVCRTAYSLCGTLNCF